MRRMILFLVLCFCVCLALLAFLAYTWNENAKVSQLCQELGWQGSRQVRGIDLCVTIWSDSSVDHALLSLELAQIQ